VTVTPTADQIEPFFFGSPGRQLFGCYHEPPAWPAREQGVVLCYPTGQEYIRSHRACHHLAAQMARAGFPTLRFDYFGTGDSAGDNEDGNLEQWQADLALAVAELRARSGVEQVILVGMRLGASLALLASSRIAGLAGLILWEPVVSGPQYLAELQQQQEDLILRFFAQPRDYRPGAVPAELLGFAISPAMHAGVAALDLLRATPPRGRPVLLIESHARPDIAALQTQLQQAARSTHIQVPTFTVWVEDVDKGLVPQQLLEAIVAWLERSFA
jgi:pimeloyl-ACP methyl ester carboxylesterase